MNKETKELINKQRYEYLQNLISQIRSHCQVDDYEIKKINGKITMVFSVEDSDCEHYFEYYNIEQKDYDNYINLDDLLDNKLKYGEYVKLQDKEEVK